MYICCECQVEMKCNKNGVGADFGHGHVYAGDRYICSVCGKEIIRTNDSANHDPEYNQCKEYLKIKERKI